MPFLLRNLTLNPGDNEDLLCELLTDRYQLSSEEVVNWSIVRKGIDARKKPRVKLVYTIEFRLADENVFWDRHGADPELSRLEDQPEEQFRKVAATQPIIIVGMGPAGLFAALRLAEYGLKPLIVDRGKPVAERVRDVQAFWRAGLLDSESNVQFGEGGAGTFSDGKLTTRVRDANSSYVLKKLVEFGAPAEILYLAKPHIGTDRLRGVITNLRLHLLSSGVDVRFQHRLTDIVVSAGRLQAVILNGTEELSCGLLILAPGHSARDTYEMLESRGVTLEAKPFSVGVRVEHPQELINGIQYGRPPHPSLPPAEYALAWNNPASGRSAYSFCMCPGGVVVAGSSEEGGVVTNGMSIHLRNSLFANSALVVNVGRDDFPGSGPLAGVEFQRRLECQAYRSGGGGYHAPAQNLLEFLGDKVHHRVSSSYLPGVKEADLTQVLPGFVTRTLQEGIQVFERKMRGFITAEATLTGVETRTSAPVRIVRGEDLQAANLAGLFPTGEGAGYAGGIMSAALDGIRVADRIAHTLIKELQ